MGYTDLGALPNEDTTWEKLHREQEMNENKHVRAAGPTHW
jgi:hypothetical protein